ADVGRVVELLELPQRQLAERARLADPSLARELVRQQRASRGPIAVERGVGREERQRLLQAGARLVAAARLAEYGAGMHQRARPRERIAVGLEDGERGPARGDGAVDVAAPVQELRAPELAAGLEPRVAEAAGEQQGALLLARSLAPAPDVGERHRELV